MNNGVNNTNTNNNNEPKTVLTPMEGVKIAPAQEGPVNASKNAQAPVQPVAQPQPVMVAPQPTKAPSPVPVQTPPTPPVSPPPAPVEAPVVEQPKKKRRSFVPVLLIVIIALGVALYYTYQSGNQRVNQLRYNCTPVSSTNQEKELSLDATIVQSLYAKVQTNIREDLAQPNFNDEMKLYLAYRQVLEKDKYESNCNGFLNNTMEPYVCEMTNTYAPKAFKVETLEIEWKELFGENTTMPKRNVQLGNTCIVGYQYIEARGEYVEGTCNQKTATSFKAVKSLTKAVSTRNTIILTEEVKYQENEGMLLPSYLKSGTYKYVFRLDMNYHYVLVSKTYESKY